MPTFQGKRSVALVSLLQLAVTRRVEMCALEAERPAPDHRARRQSIDAYVERLEAAYVSGDTEATLAVLQERWRP